MEMEEDSDEGQRSDQPTLFKPSTVRLPQQPEAKPHITLRRFTKQRESGPKHRSSNMTALTASQTLTHQWLSGRETSLFTLWLVS